MRYTLVEHVLLAAQLFDSCFLIFYFILQPAVAFGQLIQLTLNRSCLSLLAAQPGSSSSKSLLSLLLRCRKTIRRRLHLIQTTQKRRQTAFAQLRTQSIELACFLRRHSQRLDLRIHLAADIVDTRKVRPRIIKTLHCILLTQAVFGNTGRLLEQTASVLRSAV